MERKLLSNNDKQIRSEGPEFPVWKDPENACHKEQTCKPSIGTQVKKFQKGEKACAHIQKDKP